MAQHLSRAQLALIRIIARQAVKAHLTTQRQQQRDVEPECSNRAVQPMPASR
jgi:hypothetical protein